MPRMEILDKNSLHDFQKPPDFTALQRKSCFDFSNKLMEFATKMRGPGNQIGFLLSWGYFKISKRFFAPEDFHSRDIAYVARCLGYDEKAFQPTTYAKRSRQRHQFQILEIFGFRKFDDLYEKRISDEIAVMVKQYLKPKLIFWRCIDLMASDKINFPSHYRIQDLILSHMAEYKSIMNSIIRHNINDQCRAILDSLLAQSPSSQQYRLTLLKKPSQATMPVKIKDRLVDLALLAELHGYVAPLLQLLGLTAEGVRYFSASVIKTKTSHLLRREQTDVDLHLIAFIAHQYYRLQDNLVDVFLNAVKSTENMANREHRDLCYTNRKVTSSSLVEQIDQLKVDISGTFEAIRTLITDQTLADTEKLKRISGLVFPTDANSKTFQKFTEIRDGLSYSLSEDSNYYDILERRSKRLQNRVSGILKVLTFQDEGSAVALMEYMMQ